MTHIQEKNESDASAVPDWCSLSQPVRAIGSIAQPTSTTFETTPVASTEISEQMLILGAKAGCSSSFEVLYARYHRRVFRTIISITINQEDAEDALQQTFLQAFLALGKFECRSSFYSWITRIAINASFMLLRRRRSQPQVARLHSSEFEQDAWINNIPDRSPNPEQVYERAQEARKLSAALKKLRPKERAVLELHMECERSIDDVANSLDISRFAAKSRLYRARTHLMTRMKNQDASRSRRFQSSSSS